MAFTRQKEILHTCPAAAAAAASSHRGGSFRHLDPALPGTKICKRSTTYRKLHSRFPNSASQDIRRRNDIRDDFIKSKYAQDQLLTSIIRMNDTSKKDEKVTLPK
jgi:hypothetical protein